MKLHFFSKPSGLVTALRGGFKEVRTAICVWLLIAGVCVYLAHAIAANVG